MPLLGDCTLGNFVLGLGQCGVYPVMVASFDADGDGFAGNGLGERTNQLTITRGLDPETGGIVTGSAVFNLRNQDGRWSPRLASGHFYPNIKLWNLVTVERQDSTDTFRKLYTGYLREPSVDPDPNVLESNWDCVDLIERLRRVKISTPLYEGYRSDQLIAAILVLAGYTGTTDLESGSKAFPYASWRRTIALDAIQQVVSSEMGMFFIAADGRPTFHSRYHRVTTTTVGATFDATNGAAGLMVRQTADDLFNEALVTCYPRLVGTPASELWRWQEVPRLMAAGETFVIEAEYTEATTGTECEGDDIVSPVSATDYTANTASDGTGTDKTSQLNIALTAYGRYASLALTNNDSGAIYVTLLKLRGTPITTPDAVTAREVNQDSIDDLDGLVSTITLDQPLETSTDSARDAAAYLVSLHGVTRDRAVINIKPADNDRLDAMTNLDLNDRIVVDEPNNAGLVEQAFFINQIVVSVGDDPVTHVTQYETSQVPTLQLVILDSSTQTFDDLLGY
jgi:hypothetical protein